MNHLVTVFASQANQIRVVYPTPQESSILDPVKFKLDSFDLSGVTQIPTIDSISFTDTTQNSVDLNLSFSLSSKSNPVYNLTIYQHQDIYNNIYDYHVFNFITYLNEPSFVESAYFIDVDKILLNLNFDYQSLDSATFELNTLDGSGTPVSLNSIASSWGPNHILLQFGALVDGGPYKVSFDSILSQGYNLISGNVLVSNNLAAPQPYAVTDVEKYQVTGSDFQYYNPEVDFGVIRLYLNGPSNPTSSSNTANFSFIQTSVHKDPDTTSSFMVASSGSEQDFITAVCTLRTAVLNHTSVLDIHLLTPPGILVVDPTTYSEALNVFRLIWNYLNDHYLNEVIHSARDPKTDVVPVVYDDDLNFNWLSYTNVSYNFFEHLDSEFPLEFTTVWSKSGFASLDNFGSLSSNVCDSGPFHYYVDAFLSCKSPKATIRYGVDIANLGGVKSTSSLDWTGSGYIGSARFVSSQTGESRIIHSDSPFASGGAFTLYDQISVFSNLLRAYSHHLSGPHLVTDDSNIIDSNSFPAALGLDSLNSSLDAFYAKLKTHVLSTYYHYTMTNVNDESYLNKSVQEKLNYITNLLVEHTKAEDHHDYVYGNIVPPKYKSKIILNPTIAPFNTTTLMAEEVELSLYDSRAGVYTKSKFQYENYYQNLIFPSQISGAVVDSGIKYGPNGLRITGPSLSLYFTKSMRMDSLSSSNLSLTPSATIDAVGWSSDRSIYTVIPDLDNSNYDLSVNLFDSNGNSVT